jgi:hypothetical protein
VRIVTTVASRSASWLTEVALRVHQQRWQQTRSGAATGQYLANLNCACGDHLVHMVGQQHAIYNRDVHCAVHASNAWTNGRIRPLFTSDVLQLLWTTTDDERTTGRGSVVAWFFCTAAG